MSISERLRAHARMLRDQAAQLDVEATLADQALPPRSVTETVVAHCQPLRLNPPAPHGE